STGAMLTLNRTESESLGDFYAGCLGASRSQSSHGHYETLAGDVVHVLEPDEVLDAVILAQLRNDTPEQKRIYVIYERSDLDADAVPPRNVQLVRAPFDLARGHI